MLGLGGKAGGARQVDLAGPGLVRGMGWGRELAGQEEEKRMDRRRDIRPMRIERGFPFLIKLKGMKTKGVGEDSKGDRIKSNGV